MTSTFRFALPVEVYFGVGVLADLPARAAKEGRRFLLVTAPELESAQAAFERAWDASLGTLRLFLLPAPEPTCACINESAATLREEKFDAILALGGGSVIDMAKALAIALTHEKDIWLYANLSNRPPLPLERPPLPVLAAPTTAGTGSEMTPYAVLSNTDTRQKGTVQQPEIFPRAAFIDPALTCTMPAALTVATGLDALAHALESCINISKPSPFTELFGREAMRLIFAALPRVLEAPQEMEHRAAMSRASMLAGMAIAHRGTTTAHAIAEPLGALTKLSHANAVALCTIPVLKRTLARVKTSLDGVRDSADSGWRLVDDLEALFARLAVPRRLSAFRGIETPDGLAEDLVENILRYKFRPLKQHPVEFEREDLAAVVDEIVA